MIRTLSILSLGLALGGCADYLNNRDTVSFGAGDAVAWNKAAQSVDPYHRNAYDTAIAADGRAVDLAQRRRLVLLPVGVTAAPAPAAAAAN